MDRIVIKPYSKDRFELVEDYFYNDILISKGYKTNGADIPRIFWSIFPPNSPEYLSAVVVHDYMCDNGKYSKKQADEYFYKALREIGISWWKAKLFYTWVIIYHKVKSLLKIQRPYNENNKGIKYGN